VIDLSAPLLHAARPCDSTGTIIASTHSCREMSRKPGRENSSSKWTDVSPQLWKARSRLGSKAGQAQAVRLNLNRALVRAGQHR